MNTATESEDNTQAMDFWNASRQRLLGERTRLEPPGVKTAKLLVPPVSPTNEESVSH